MYICLKSLKHTYYLGNLKRGGGGIDSQGMFNTQPPTGKSVEELDAGDHAAYELEGAGITGEVTVHERTENI